MKWFKWVLIFCAVIGIVAFFFIQHKAHRWPYDAETSRQETIVAAKPIPKRTKILPVRSTRSGLAKSERDSMQRIINALRKTNTAVAPAPVIVKSTIDSAAAAQIAEIVAARLNKRKTITPVKHSRRRYAPPRPSQWW
jgi:hypothetical protein